MYASNTDQVFARYGKANVKAIIGGTDFNESSWSTLAYNLATWRTLISFKDDYAYLIVGFGTIPVIKSQMSGLRLDPVNTVVLDGSDSTQMNVETNGTMLRPPEVHDRYVFNMVRLINAY